MGRLTYGKRDIAKVAAAIDQQHDTVEDAAAAALDAALEVLQDRAKFTVVGQLSGIGTRTVQPGEEEAVKVCLGFFSTEGDAKTAAGQLVYQAQSGETYRVWVLNVFHGSPHEFSGEQKKKYQALEAKQEAVRREAFRKSMEKREAEMAERAAEYRKAG